MIGRSPGGIGQGDKGRRQEGMLDFLDGGVWAFFICTLNKGDKSADSHRGSP